MSAVICYGSVIADRVLELPRFPRPGEGVHALGERLYVGGEPCNVGGHLAAWGVEVAIAGNRLGDDPLGAFLREQLQRRPRTRLVVESDPAIQTPTCYIWITPDGERTIVPSWPTPTGWTLPGEDLLRSARIVSTSIYGPGMDEMLSLARRRQLPLAVADISGPDDSRLPGAAIVTTSRAVLHFRHNVEEIESWMAAVHAVAGATVVVSDGPQPALALSASGDWLSVQPPRIAPVDTTGAGDALKAGMILGWLNEWPLDQTLRWSCAAAGLQCLQPGPCEDPPPGVAIEALLSSIKVEQLRQT
ncbi:MAG TPA: carbohydrate kinase family protein [Herpetosiphonaceae bacterium]